MKRGDRLNDDDRRQWIDNDEGLYLWWRGSRDVLAVTDVYVRLRRGKVSVR